MVRATSAKWLFHQSRTHVQKKNIKLHLLNWKRKFGTNHIMRNFLFFFYCYAFVHSTKKVMTLKLMHDWTFIGIMTRSKIKNSKIAPKHSNQWENAFNGETYLSKESELLSEFLSPLTPPPPPPTSAESGGPLLVPHYLNPLSCGNVPPRSG